LPSTKRHRREIVEAMVALRSPRLFSSIALATSLAAALAACGDDSVPSTQVTAELCASPRTGTDPETGKPFTDQQGTVGDEKAWVRAWIDQFYLWYSEVPSLDASAYPDAVKYFAVLKTSAKTSTGAYKDRFHFTYTTAEWDALSQSGVEVGYGVRWALLAASPPRRGVVAYVEPGLSVPLARGAEVITVDGAALIDSADVDTLNNGMWPSKAGEMHTFVVKDVGATTTRTVVLTSAPVTSQPVQHVGTLAGGEVGYILFNDHIATAEPLLKAAIQQLKDAGVKDLVLDLRYNGGGYLDIASELAYMIAGPTVTTGKIFDLQRFNDKYPDTNPITQQPLTPTPFHDTDVFQAMPQPLPYLGLSRVYVLTGPTTCSASEAVINGLMGVGVQVIQIGGTTCGKPYGFYPQDNCGTTFFAIQFQGVNDMGFGDYTDGFSADGATNAHLTGCNVPDDFTHALGDASEGRLAAALAYRTSGTCPASAAAAARMAPSMAPLSAVDGLVIKPAPLMNRIDRK
jgi:carboxyl-terminal processing protease